MTDSKPASNEVKEKVISEYIKTATGRQKLAASMIQPLRFRRDYTSVGRRAFLVEQLPDGVVAM
jgi:hypothetical protein